ncbi:Spy/CpxP family protein refolding chaperone [Bradyrhizobium iriomotense]|uniref:Spy/CpxP family protein refolding chaperone n=1 Tax=Bradyrhizobium iriomotense TaxID=441950 RepID=UPI001B8A81CE|nr:Spy/CpxP family protein refolding chaperone [Bradyrhizobium iriomotense]MBR0783178.1 Spy/CpxP family protein refolding chaperone [Bradyrhizobium iriomotense]
MQRAADFDTSVRKSCRRFASIWPDPPHAVLIVPLDEQMTTRIKPWRLTMNCSRKFAVYAAAFAVLALGPVGLSSAIAAGLTRTAMMDDDKMSKMPPPSDSSDKTNMSQPQNMSGGRMNDDKMKMPQQGQDNSGMTQMMPMMQMMEKMMRGQMSSSGSSGAMSGPVDVTERIEGRIAFLKAELQISDKQAADWNSVADALRSSRQHLLEARKMLAMDDRMGSADRLEHYERHLSERLEAIKSARLALTRLYASLNESQKQTADTILLPLIASF